MPEKPRVSSSRDFFKSLYEQPEVVPQTEYDEAVTRLVARFGDNTVVGDQALQSLLVNYTLNNANSLDEVKKLSTALAGIKQRAVTEVLRAFPDANLGQLVSAARSAGYDVQVLK